MLINTWRDPYDSGFSPTRPKTIELKPGLTVLVGCNGAGKTTLLKNIESELKKETVPCVSYDNLHDGGSSAVSELFFREDYGLGALLFTSSEGESIKLNIGRQAEKYKKFIKTGFFDSHKNRLRRAFSEEEETVKTNIRVLLFDAIDSGLSVDAIVDVKNLFSLILEDAKKENMEMYIIVSANEYELARGEKCFDVNTGKYVSIKTYEAYRKFILKSRDKKEERLAKQKIWREKQDKKRIVALKNEIKKLNIAIEKLEKKNNEKDRFCDRYKIESLKRDVKRKEEELEQLEKCQDAGN